MDDDLPVMNGCSQSSAIAAAIILAACAFASAAFLSRPASAANTAHLSDAPRLSLPIACEAGKTCFIQSHVDLDPGPAARDFRCGSATYDGHKGVDFRLLSAHAAQAGVPVLAAADGVVRRRRDGMEDVFVTPATMDKIRPLGCGNSLVIDHGNGWRTAYCHMRKGSVAVKPGTVVHRGDRLGDVGYSGLVEFAHLHFMVLHKGKVVDPESGLSVGEACIETAGQAGAPSAPGALWDESAANAFGYRNGEIIGAGFTAQKPDTGSLEKDHRLAPPRPDSKALIFYARLINLRAGDQVALAVDGPGTFKLDVTTKPLNRSKATYLSFFGRRLRAKRWPAGTYEGSVRVLRGNRILTSRSGLTLDFP
jgi:hypothetical protein